MPRTRCIQNSLALAFLLGGLVMPPAGAADVKVSNLDDINFGRYSGTGNLQQSDNLCINSLPQGTYSLVFWGSGSTGAFSVSNGLSEIPFKLRYNDRARSNGGSIVTPGIPLTRQRRAENTLDCPGGLNANIDVRFRQQDLRQAPPGRYIGLLTVTVSPE